MTGPPERPTPSTIRPRVLLVDDHELILDAVEALLAHEWDIVGKLRNAGALLDTAQTLRPDVVLLDIAMPSGNCLDMARQLTREMPDVKVIFVTMMEDRDVMAQAFRIGAAGYVVKRSAASELSAAMHAVMRGKQYVSSVLAQAVLQSLTPPSKPVELSPRQQEVLRLLANGYAMKEIATALDISSRTVAFHKYQMMEQLGIKSSAELIQYAVRRKII
jgi:DNA-binding NarL/FixJ family response regulator